MGFFQQCLDIRVQGLVALDRLRMNAAEDQQVMILGQIAQRAQRGLEALVRREEAERADQPGLWGQRMQRGERRACRHLARGLGLLWGDETERMMVDVVDPEHVAQQAGIALCMDDRMDRLGVLQPAQQAVGPLADRNTAAPSADGLKHLVEAPGDQAASDPRPVQGLVPQDGVEGDREHRRRLRQHPQTADDLAWGAAQRAVFQLDVHAVIGLQAGGQGLDMAVGEPLHPLMRAAQKVLVQIQHGDVGMRA